MRAAGPVWQAYTARVGCSIARNGYARRTLIASLLSDVHSGDRKDTQVIGSRLCAASLVPATEAKSELGDYCWREHLGVIDTDANVSHV